MTMIPESDEEVERYSERAGANWDRNERDEAYEDYYAITQSAFGAQATRSLAAYRAAEIARDRGETDLAIRLCGQSTEPEAHHLNSLLRGETPDQQVDPNRPPSGFEEAGRYWRAADEALAAGDRGRALSLYRAIEQGDLQARDVGMVRVRIASLLIDDGDQTEARRLLELALPNVDGEWETAARDQLARIGTESPGDAAAAQLQEGPDLMLHNATEAYERGDLVSATQDFTWVINSVSATNAQRGRAAYYLGSIERHNGDYSAARNWYGRAASQGEEPERSWANQVLEERWQEEQAGAYAH